MDPAYTVVTGRRRLRVEIRGAVQGVGFRPFVYRLATGLGLTGWVINDSRGVFVEVEGPPERLVIFLERLPAEKPPPALIHSLEAQWLEPVGFRVFEIRHSQDEGAKTVLVLPDIAVCPDCLREVWDAADRRYRYPFTNCTNCGPRFTIIQALPYDRPNTTMRRFTMCSDCQAEYSDPLNRRFHAQPNACPRCGPQLTLWSASGQTLAGGDDALQQAARAIQDGLIVAVKGLGGFHLMVDAADAQAVARLRQRKQRPDKPLALMLPDLNQAHRLCEVPLQAEALLTSPEAPIVLVARRPGAAVANEVAPHNPTLGIMLPYTPLHHLLLQATGRPVVATSGNLSDEPICIDEHEALQRLGQIADLFLVHDRPITRHADDSIAWVVCGEARLLRRARGYAPLPVLVPQVLPTILAVGAHLKNTVALSVERQVFISQHIGDLETAEALAAFERVIADFMRLYQAVPTVMAHDLHPDYLSTQWVQAHRLPERWHALLTSAGLDQAPIPGLVPVQHHHAHLAACLAENRTPGVALGVTWDGTGYGSDGTIWGGEFLLGDAAGFTRVAHMRPFRLPGGEAAVHEPRRVALALLWEIMGESALERDDLAPLPSFTATERRILAQLLRQGVHAPLTTSAGRLFDGIAALIGLRQQVSYEGQAAMELEFIADAQVDDAYPVQIAHGGSHSPGLPGKDVPWVVDWEPMVWAVLEDLRRGVPAGTISARFHNGLVQAILEVARRVGEPRVALTGGCFQNRWLTEHSAQCLEKAGFQVLLHRQVPPNDGCVSLGQVMVAAAQLTGNVDRITR